MRTSGVDRNEKSVWWELGASGFKGRVDQKGNTVPHAFAPTTYVHHSRDKFLLSKTTVDMWGTHILQKLYVTRNVRS